MTLGLPLHTHAEVKGVRGVQLVKLLTPAEADASSLPSDRVCIASKNGGWASQTGLTIDQPRLPEVLSPGDVVRVRERGSLVSVVWRRAARTNSLFATERCNSLCLMCSQPPRDELDDWRVNELLATVPLIDRDAEQLGVTGGEPTLLGDRLTDVLTSCGQHLPNTRLHVLTNGRRFRDPSAAHAWTKAGGSRTTWAVPLYADLPDVHDEVVGADGAFDETLEGLVELAANHARVEIRVVLHRLTIPRLKQLAVLIYRRLPFVEHVALMGLEPMGYAKLNRDRLWIDPVDYIEELRSALFYLTNRGMTVSIYNLPLCVLPEPLWPFARQSISEWKNSFASECSGCAVSDRCSGFFASAGPAWRSRAIHPLAPEEVQHEMA